MSAPKVLGLEMVWIETMWTLDFGVVSCCLLPLQGGLFSAMVADTVLDGDTEVQGIAAIEHELLAIRNAIPPVCYHCRDALVSERDRCERCPAECDGDCTEEECEARAEAIKSATST